MRLVLDANEYIFALGASRDPSCERLLAFLRNQDHQIRVVRTIVREVNRNISPRAMHDFFETLDVLLEPDCGVDGDYVIPHHIAQHYQDIGFKEGDAHIAAYAETIQADVVISENRRDFHAMAHRLPFQVMDAAKFLKLHK